MERKENATSFVHVFSVCWTRKHHTMDGWWRKGRRRDAINVKKQFHSENFQRSSPSATFVVQLLCMWAREMKKYRIHHIILHWIDERNGLGFGCNWSSAKDNKQTKCSNRTKKGFIIFYHFELSCMAATHKLTHIILIIIVIHSSATTHKRAFCIQSV